MDLLHHAVRAFRMAVDFLQCWPAFLQQERFQVFQDMLELLFLDELYVIRKQDSTWFWVSGRFGDMDVWVAIHRDQHRFWKKIQHLKVIFL